MTRTLLFVVNVDWFFLSHRLPIALAAQSQGFDVHVATTLTDRKAILESHGFTIHPLRITRGAASPLQEATTFLQLFRLFQKLRPDVVHLVTIKPVLFGGIAARFLRIPTVAAISGLGFTHVAKGMIATVKRWVIAGLYRLALERKRTVVILQNTSDLQHLRSIVKLPAEQFTLIPGSGVDLRHYVPTPLPPGTPLVLMACRLIAHKGVWDFVQAATILHARGVSARFCLAGTIDPENPASLTEADLARIRKEGIVELLGQREDMQQLMAESHIVVLPSYYGEGVPKVLIEAAACARAIITTDMPGCRDTVELGKSGLLVPARNPQALAEAIEQLINNHAQCEALGVAGRTLAEQLFDVSHVVNTHLQIYETLSAS